MYGKIKTPLISPMDDFKIIVGEKGLGAHHMIM